jgi:very-short-patch-repair endonuclease
MALRLSPSDAAIRGIISKEEAANMERLARDRRNPARIPAQTGAALKPNQKPTEAAKALAAAVRAGNEIPQRRLFEELSLRLPGIPQWEREDLIPDRKFRADIFLPPDLVLELDGWAYHSSRKAFKKDRLRSNLFTLHGFRVFRAFTKQCLDEVMLGELVQQIVQAYEVPIRAREV